MIGDGIDDVISGEKAGCKTILIKTSYNDGVEADIIVPDLITSLNYTHHSLVG